MAEVTVKRANLSPGEIQAQGRELLPIYQSAITVLSWGFRIGAATLGIGLLVAIIRQESIRTNAEAYPDILPSVFDGEASGIISLAIVVLVATPVVTVLMVATGFFRIGDRRFGLLSLIVLAVLGVSISLSLFR
jgi:uncharacterized membrane protein